jgi:hypothetical protein
MCLIFLYNFNLKHFLLQEMHNELCLQCMQNTRKSSHEVTITVAHFYPKLECVINFSKTPLYKMLCNSLQEFLSSCTDTCRDRQTDKANMHILQLCTVNAHKTWRLVL